MTISATAPVDRRHVLRVWMLDDDAGYRQAFAQLLSKEPRLKISQQFGSIPELLTALAEQRAPDLILLDLNIGPENGLTAVQPIKKLAPTAKVLILTTFTNTYAETEAFQLGAAGFLLKIYDLPEIVDLIYQAFYQPADPRLFPTVSARRAYASELAPAAKTGLVTAVKQFWRRRRSQAA